MDDADKEIFQRMPPHAVCQVGMLRGGSALNNPEVCLPRRTTKLSGGDGKTELLSRDLTPARLHPLVITLFLRMPHGLDADQFTQSLRVNIFN